MGSVQAEEQNLIAPAAQSLAKPDKLEVGQIWQLGDGPKRTIEALNAKGNWVSPSSQFEWAIAEFHQPESRWKFLGVAPGYGPSGRAREDEVSRAVDTILRHSGASPSAPQSASTPMGERRVEGFWQVFPVGCLGCGVVLTEVRAQCAGCSGDRGTQQHEDACERWTAWCNGDRDFPRPTGERPRSEATPKDSGPIRALPQKAATCGHRHTGYGLTCALLRGHQGDHQNREATWPRDPEVVRLKAPKVYAGQPSGLRCDWFDGKPGDANRERCPNMRPHRKAVFCEEHISRVMNDRRPKAGPQESEFKGGLRPQSFSITGGLGIWKR